MGLGRVRYGRAGTAVGRIAFTTPPQTDGAAATDDVEGRFITLGPVGFALLRKVRVSHNDKS